MSEIRIYPDSVLIRKSIPLERIDSKTIDIIEKMTETMYLYKGIGLSAPQIGILSRIIVVNSEHGLIPLINPEIIESEGDVKGIEGCLSLPEVEVNVERSQKILVRGVDLNEKETEFEGSGFLARVFQHEIDHLEGKLIVDYLSQLKRNLIKSKFKKRRRL